jgi:hypothetical protein
VRGTLEQVNGNALTTKTRNETTTTIQLKDGAAIVAVTKGAMSDIKENSYVGIAAMPQPDGTIKAIEVSVFAEPLRGTAEGHFPWDLMPNSTMTNAAVTQQVGEYSYAKIQRWREDHCGAAGCDNRKLDTWRQSGSQTRSEGIHSG